MPCSPVASRTATRAGTTAGHWLTSRTGRWASACWRATSSRAAAAPDTPYTPVPKLTLETTRTGQELAVVGNFAEVWLAREGHDGVVGINCLEKIQMATPTALLGAMLAGADYVLMGAGIPREVPQLLRSLAAREVGRIPVDVAGGTLSRVVEVDPAPSSVPTCRR